MLVGLTPLAEALTSAKVRWPAAAHRYTHMSIETYIYDMAAGRNKLKLKPKYQRASRKIRRKHR